MKTIFGKAIAAFVFLLAIGGAFAFTDGKSDLGPYTGYIDWSSPCTQSVTCEENFRTNLCTVIINGTPHQAKGKMSPGSVSCTKTLYRPDPN